MHKLLLERYSHMSNQDLIQHCIIWLPNFEGCIHWNLMFMPNDRSSNQSMYAELLWLYTTNRQAIPGILYVANASGSGGFRRLLLTTSCQEIWIYVLIWKCTNVFTLYKNKTTYAGLRRSFALHTLCLYYNGSLPLFTPDIIHTFLVFFKNVSGYKLM